MAKEFKTDNLALCPYLELYGLKYLRSELSLGKNDKPIVCFIFEDKRGVGRDLELDFVRSNEKRYRDLLFLLLHLSLMRSPAEMENMLYNTFW